MDQVTPLHLSTLKSGEELNVPVGHFLLAHLKSNAKRVSAPAQIVAQNGSTTTYPELLARSVRLAAGWRSLGLGRGDLLAVYSWNRADVLPAILGALFEAITVVLIVPFAKRGELCHYLSTVSPKAMLSEEALLDNALAEAKPGTTHIVLGPKPVGQDNILSLEDVLRQGDKYSLDPATYNAAAVPNTMEHVASITYSSGTTGLNKAVMMSNRSLCIMAHDTSEVRRSLPGERVLITHPLSWGTGMITALLCVVCGNTAVLSNFSNEDGVLSDLQRYKVTTWQTAPSRLLLLSHQVNDLRAQQRGSDADLSSLRYVKSTGAALGAEDQRLIEATLGVPVLQTYGCTELWHMAGYPVTDVEAGTLSATPGATGRVCPGVKLRLVDVDTGLDVERPGVAGEVRALTPYRMKGYADPAVPSPWDEQGYYRTGDVAYLDQGGELHVVDRIKELITFDEYDVAPAEIESVLKSHPSVQEACVVGREHSVLGQLPAAFVVLRHGATASATELQDLVKGRLADHKRLRGGVHFVDHIPKSTYGKTLRSRLREKLHQLPAVNDEDLK